MKIFLSIVCALFCVTWAEISLERHRRQTGLNGAHTDAMDRSRDGGLGGSYNPLKTAGPGDFGGRLGGGFGGKISDNVGIGAAVRSDVGIGNGGPFVRAPEVGVGATYHSGPNSFSLGAGRTFGGAPSNQVGFTFSRTFKRSVDDYEGDRVYRKKRQAAMNTAMTNSLTNKPPGTPQFSYQIDAAGNSGRNFGAAGNAGAGVKVWESGRQSVGLGAGIAGNLARVDGTTYTGTPQVGAGIGYQNGAFSASVGAGRPTVGSGRNTQYGLQFGYKFKRSAGDEFQIGHNKRFIRETADHTAEDLELDHTAEDFGLKFKREAADYTAEDFDIDHTAEDLNDRYYN